MTHAIRFHKTGGPEVLVWEEVPVGKPGPGEARIRHTAVGLTLSTSTIVQDFIPASCPAVWAARALAWSRKSDPASPI